MEMERDNFTSEDWREALLERYKLEEEFALDHKTDSDEALFAYLRDCAACLNHQPTKKDVIGCRYLKQRFGPLHQVLEKAGLKTVGNRRLNGNNDRTAVSDPDDTAI